MLIRLFNDTQNAASVVVFTSFLALSAALIAQYFFELHPCVLCIYQRIPYVFAIAFGLISYGAAKQDKDIANLFLGVAGVMFLINFGIAGFHVGVENGWWEGLSECGGGDTSDLTLEELRMQILNAPVVKCNEVAWSLFGISMAGYNAALSFFLTIYSFLSVKKGLEHHDAA